MNISTAIFIGSQYTTRVYFTVRMFRKIERVLPLINCIIASSGLGLQIYSRNVDRGVLNRKSVENIDILCLGSQFYNIPGGGGTGG